MYLTILLILLPLVNSCRILSLSGGGAYGAFEAGVVYRMIEEGNGGWDLITGVSAGSINGMYLSTIKPEDEIKNMETIKNLWLQTKTKDIYNWEFFLNGYSVANNNILKTTLSKIFENKKIVRPFLMSLTSLSLGNSVIRSDQNITQDKMVESLMGSSAIPLFFPPYELDGDVYVDGGLSGNILISEAIEYCSKIKPFNNITIDAVLTGKQNSYQEISSLKNLKSITLFSRLIDIILEQVEYHEIYDNNQYNYKINKYEPVDSFGVSVVDFNQPEKLFQIGYDLYGKKNEKN